MKKILIATMVFLSLCISSVSAIAAPVVEDVTIVPEEPTRKSTITITTTITSEDVIDGVKLNIKECSESYCHQADTLDMNLVNGKYQYEYALKWNDAVYFNYTFIISSGGESFTTDETKVLLKLDSGNGDTNGNGNGGNGSPGFELILLIIAVFIGVILLKRKRSR
jgi:hypothetical protein